MDGHFLPGTLQGDKKIKGVYKVPLRESREREADKRGVIFSMSPQEENIPGSFRGMGLRSGAGRFTGEITRMGGTAQAEGCVHWVDGGGVQGLRGQGASLTLRITLCGHGEWGGSGD